ncbi:MAG: response regulator [Elusimicrobia bacterium]|nr:response regulator [Elusimicrobiota bacterium]
MPIRILYADSDPDTLLLVSKKLAKRGYVVISAGEGKQALELIRKEKPELIILDYFLPTMKGDEVCRLVKADAELKRIPVILLSASTAMLPPEVCEAIPCDDRMNKPFDMSILLEKVTRLAPLPEQPGGR